jgi:exoribonuclease II
VSGVYRACSRQRYVQILRKFVAFGFCFFFEFQPWIRKFGLGDMVENSMVKGVIVRLRVENQNSNISVKINEETIKNISIRNATHNLRPRIKFSVRK